MQNSTRIYRRLEYTIKGFANRKRLEIIDLLNKQPELSVDEIAEKLRLGYMNTSDHLRKMAIAGLVLKRSDGPHIRHKLTDRALNVLAFCKKLE